MNLNRFYFSFLTIFFLFTSCMDKIDSRKLEVSNSSEDKIYTIITDLNIENDTLNNYGKLGVFDDLVLPGVTKEIDRPADWKTFMDKSWEGKLRLYIIAKDSVDKYGWEAIGKRNIYNKKYELDIETLDSLNWRIEYHKNWINNPFE